MFDCTQPPDAHAVSVSKFRIVVERAARSTFGEHYKFDSNLEALTFDGLVVPLSNLYRTVKPADQSKWFDLVCRRLEDALLTSHKLASTPGNWPMSRPNIYICVRTRCLPNQVGKALLDGLFHVLILNAEPFCVHITYNQLSEWGVSAETAWNTALENNSHRLQVKSKIITHRAVDIEVISGDMCASGIITDLTSHSTIAKSNKQVVLALPTSEEAIVLTDRLPPTTAQQIVKSLSLWSENAQHPLSPELFKFDAEQGLISTHPIDLPQRSRRYQNCPTSQY